MLSKRIIACLDVRNGQVVKGVNFEGLRNAGDPAELAERYNEEGIDEVVILDVTATLEGRRALAATVSAVARRIFIPLTVGGGIRSEDDAAAAIDAGAEKVSLNTAALSNPDAHHDARLAVRQPGGDRRDRRQVGRRPGARLRAERAIGHRARSGRMGEGGRRPRRRRNPADVDRSRWHQDGLRLRADGGRLESGRRFR